MIPSLYLSFPDAVVRLDCIAAVRRFGGGGVTIDMLSGDSFLVDAPFDEVAETIATLMSSPQGADS